MKNVKRILHPLLCLVLLLFLFVGSTVTVHAETHRFDEIALTPGFYCLHPHKKTPNPNEPIRMEAVPSTEYTEYSDDTKNQLAGATILRGDYYRETEIEIDNDDLQSVIWAIVCKKEFTAGGTNLHLNGRPVAQAYYAYVMENYPSVIGKYTMTIWVSSDKEYQDILEAKMVEKHAVPHLEKKVKDRNDSASPDFDQKGWQDSADYDIGDTIPFQITAQMNDMTGFRAFYLEFVDHMTHLTLDPDTLYVTIDGEDKTDDFDISWDPDTKDLNIKCDNILNLGAKTDSQVVVTYNATLDASANIGYEGNPNEVYMIYSRTSGSADKGISPTDKVTVFTFACTVNKITEDHKALNGAAFELFKWIADDSAEGGHYKSLGAQGAEKNEDGTDKIITSFHWSGIDDGQYKIEEVVTPVGYNTIEPIVFTITALHDHLSDDPMLYHLNSDFPFKNTTPLNFTETDEDGNPIMVEGAHFSYDGTVEADIVNKPGTVLPETGGMGTYPIYLVSAVLMLTATVLLLKKLLA